MNPPKSTHINDHRVTDLSFKDLNCSTAGKKLVLTPAERRRRMRHYAWQRQLFRKQQKIENQQKAAAKLHTCGILKF